MGKMTHVYPYNTGKLTHISSIIYPLYASIFVSCVDVDIYPLYANVQGGEDS